MLFSLVFNLLENNMRFLFLSRNIESILIEDKVLSTIIELSVDILFVGCV